MIEICAGVEAVAQPSPAMNPGGDCFACALTAGLATERTRDRVLPHSVELEHWSYAWALEIDEGAYVRRLEGYLRGGWIAATEIRHAGGGPFTPEGQRRMTDHFVLIDGVRYGWERSSEVSRSLRHYIRVVCSARGAYWIGVDHFLRQHGGAGWTLFRRDDR